MPDRTGLDLLPLLRNLPDAPPIIYVTANDNRHSRLGPVWPWAMAAAAAPTVMAALILTRLI